MCESYFKLRRVTFTIHKKLREYSLNNVIEIMRVMYGLIM